MDCIVRLFELGYRFTLAGDKISYKLAGGGKDPDPVMTKLLLAELKARKQEAIAYLQSTKRELFDPDRAVKLAQILAGKPGTGGKVWRLTGDQAQELESLFAGPDMVERKGRRWCTVDKWLEKEKAISAITRDGLL